MDKNETSQRHRELQTSEARAHAARVSSRKARRIGKFTSKSSMPSNTQSSLALRPVHGTLIRHRKVLKEEEEEEEHNIHMDKRRFHPPSTASLGQGQLDPFDSAPVKGLNNFIHSILDFGTS